MSFPHEQRLAAISQPESVAVESWGDDPGPETQSEQLQRVPDRSHETQGPHAEARQHSDTERAPAELEAARN